MKVFSKILDFFFSMKMMVLLMLIYAIAIGRATFIEDIYDTPAAKIMVFNAVWFEMLNLILGINLIGGMFKYKMFRKEKLAQLTFHFSFTLILLGAGISRYAGFEGVMVIKEGTSRNLMYSSEPYVQFSFHQLSKQDPTKIDSSGYKVQKWMSEPTQNHNSFEYDFDLNNNTQVKVNYNWYRTEVVYDVFDGKGSGEEILLIKYGRTPRDTFYLRNGAVREFKGGIKLAFNNFKYTDAIQFRSENKGEVKLKAPFDIEVLDQNKAKDFEGGGMPPRDTLIRDTWHNLRPRVVHFVQGTSFFYTAHFDDVKLGFRKQNQLEKERKAGSSYLSVDVLYKNNRRTLVFEGKPTLPTRPRYALFEDLMVKVGYGPILREIPFSVTCKDFRLEKYSGSEMASSYECDLMINDGNDSREATVFMNNVLDHKGYRFFQSAFDVSPEAKREGGEPDITVLSVNHDKWGTLVTYIGYILMAFGFMWALFVKNSRFTFLRKKVEDLNQKRKTALLKVLCLGLLSGAGFDSFAQNNKLDALEIQKEFDAEYVNAAKKILIQSAGGRIEPLQSHALNVVYKVHKKRSYDGLSATEVYLSMLSKPYPWYSEPIISIKNPEVAKLIGLPEGENYAAVKDFLDTAYFADQKLQTDWNITDAFNESKRTRDVEKTSFDKDLIKAVDQFEVMLNTLSGLNFRAFPVSDNKNNKWVSLSEMMIYNGEQSTEMIQVSDIFFTGMLAGINAEDWTTAGDGLNGLIAFQQQYGGEILPSKSKVNLEIIYNNANIFFYLMMVYSTLGFILLFILIFGVFMKPTKAGRLTVNIFKYIVIGVLALHAVGLGVRWYVTGHAPWSNGYEALVFIGFVTVLAGVLFAKATRFTLAGAPILAALILGVAHGASVDPQLTNLVPVLKSYWLVVHVAIITGSYGFLGLGAILTLINLILYTVRGNRKLNRVRDAIDEMTYTAELTMTVGLYMAAIGTFLGGVWANESWGRYWGWDAKETWALVIVIVYSLILHTRFIPWVKQKVVFNILSLWAFGTVIMTYFGVNFLLSKGLHSYARGDKATLPTWAFITMIVIGLICIVAYIQNKRYNTKVKLN